AQSSHVGDMNTASHRSTRGSAPSFARLSRVSGGRHNFGEARCSYRSIQGGEGVLVGRCKRATKETRDRAERGSAVRGSAGASVRPKRTSSPTAYRDASTRKNLAPRRDHRSVVSTGRLDRALLRRVINVN